MPTLATACAPGTARPRATPGRPRGVTLRPHSTVSPVHHSGGIREAGGLPLTRYATLATTISCARSHRDPAGIRVRDGPTLLIRAVSGAAGRITDSRKGTAPTGLVYTFAVGRRQDAEHSAPQRARVHQGPALPHCCRAIPAARRKIHAVSRDSRAPMEGLGASCPESRRQSRADAHRRSVHPGRTHRRVQRRPGHSPRRGAARSAMP